MMTWREEIERVARLDCDRESERLRREQIRHGAEMVARAIFWAAGKRLEENTCRQKR